MTGLLPLTVEQKIETRNAVVRIHTNGLLTLHHLPGVTESHLDDFKRNHEALKELANGRPRPFLMNTGGVHRISNESKSYMNSTLLHLAERMALVPGDSNAMAKMAIRIYLILHRPAIPTAVFRDDEQAVKWLLSQKKET
ncbi:MAG: hypothetical protein K1X56_07485 [Flavobacteriales bacterium]|nr:hypothetical protein [Flavobacteriales bacterium]